MSDTRPIGTSELRALASAALRSAGANRTAADRTADILVESELMGIATHGAARIPPLCARLASRSIDPAATVAIARRAPSLAHVDGANALGPAVASAALDAAIEIALETGIAYVACRHSNHLGALAPYALRACEAGLVLVAGTNASAMMAPWGGAEARLGNNPLAIGAPVADGPHFILDMAMSEAARSKIRAAATAGTSLPTGWAADRDGVPTTDPHAALAGLLLPIGGHKGSGLALAIDILAGVMSGGHVLNEVASGIDDPASRSNLAHVFIAIDPDRLVGRDVYAAGMNRLRAIATSTPPGRGVAEVTLPGERMQARRRQALVDGLNLPTALLDDVRRWARQPAP